MDAWDVIFKFIGSAGAALSFYLWWTRRVTLAVTIEEPRRQPTGQAVAGVHARIVNRSHERSARLYRFSLFASVADSNEWTLVCRDESVPRVLEPRARHTVQFDMLATTAAMISNDLMRVEVELEDGQFERSSVHQLFRK